MRNIILALAPFYSTGNAPTIAAVSSQDAVYFPVENVLNYRRPRLPWRTATTGSTAEVTIDVGATPSLSGVFVARTNYQEARLLRVVGATESLVGPNIIKNSHDFSKWTVAVAGSTVTPNYSSGPDPFSTKASRVQLASGGYVTTTNYGTFGPSGELSNVPYVASVWAKALPGTTLAIGSLHIYVDGTSRGSVSIPLTYEWKKYTLTGTVPSSLTGPNFQMVIFFNLCDCLLWGAQLTPRTTVEPFTTYETGTNGIIIETNPLTNRRQTFFDLCGQSIKRIKLQVPTGVTTDTPTNYFETSVFLPIESTTQVFGGHSTPTQPSLVPAYRVTEFENKNVEYLKLGEHKARFTIPQVWAMEYSRAQLYSMLQLDPGKGILYIENMKNPGGPANLPDPSMAYLVYASNIDDPVNAVVPEYAERSLVLEEFSG